MGGGKNSSLTCFVSLTQASTVLCPVYKCSKIGLLISSNTSVLLILHTETRLVYKKVVSGQHGNIFKEIKNPIWLFLNTGAGGKFVAE